MTLPRASSVAPDPTKSPNTALRTESVDKNQGVLSEKQTPDPVSSPLDMVLSESRETSLVVRNDEDNEDIPSSLGGEHSTTNTALGCSQDPSLSSRGEQNGDCLGENNTVTVVIPAARPPKPHAKRSAKRPHRRRPKRQTSRTAPFDEEDDSDDPDDDDYVERTPQVDDRYRPTKKPRQLPVTNSDRSDVGAAVGFQLGGLSLPDLRTVQRGVLTCEFFPLQIMYSFSWAEERQCLDHLPTKDDLPSQGYNHHDVNSAQEWKPCASSKGETHEISCSKQQDSQLSARVAEAGKPLKRKEWTPEEDARLKQLREKDKLPWSQVKKHFPTRTAGAIQVRYYTALKDSTSMSCAPTRAHSDRSASFSPSIEPVLQNRTKDTLDTASDVTSRSRPVRARRPVERYS
jgi:hypothetical protein